MKDRRFWLTALVLLLTVNTAEAAWFPSFWTDWLEKYNEARVELKKQPLEYNRFYRGTRFRRSSGTPRDVQEQHDEYEARTSVPLRRTPAPASQRSNAESFVRVNVTPIRPSEPIRLIDEDPVRIFSLGFRHAGEDDSLRFTPAVTLDTLSFQVFGNRGISQDLDNLRLIVEGVEGEFEFEEDKTLTLNLNGLRLARGESRTLTVSLKVFDPSATAHKPGTLRVRFLGATAQTELGNETVSVKRLGTPISDQIVFDPDPVTTGTPEFSARPATQVHGQMLSAGSEALVLTLNLSAYYDDMLLREVTVADTLSSGGVDAFIDRVSLQNLKTGDVLATGRFVNGDARLKLSSRLQIDRGGETVPLGVFVQLDDRIRADQINAQFRLTIEPEDLIVQGIGSGTDVPDSHKNFSLDTETFTVVQNTLGVSLGSQPDGFGVGTGQPETVFRFQLKAGGRQDAALGRISFRVTPEGMDFRGGSISPDDFRLVQEVNGQQYLQPGTFSVSGTTATFDPTREILLSRRENAQFALQVALESAGGNPRADSLVVQIVGDDTRDVGTLGNVRSSGANFIWSDLSGSPHGTSSADWMSGYQVPGLPSLTTVIKRYGE